MRTFKDIKFITNIRFACIAMVSRIVSINDAVSFIVTQTISIRD